MNSFGLTESMYSIDGLILYRGIPPEIEQHYMSSGDQIQSYTEFERTQQNARFLSFGKWRDDIGSGCSSQGSIQSYVIDSLNLESFLDDQEEFSELTMGAAISKASLKSVDQRKKSHLRENH